MGDAAPLVTGPNQDGKEWKLADTVGKKVVLLYFYPKDETPGCTKEACGLRDSMGELQSKDVEVVGVSFDDAASHQSFIAKHNLNFTLIADTNGKIADAYGGRRGKEPGAAGEFSYWQGRQDTARDGFSKRGQAFERNEGGGGEV